MILIAASKKDRAGLNISRGILQQQDLKETSKAFQGSPVYEGTIEASEVSLVTLEQETVFAQNLLNFFKPELIVFVSRHSSESGRPTLSVHPPGNLGEAKLGGIPGKVSIAPATAMRTALIEMVRLRDERNLCYDASYEGTHHGPSLDAPAMFVELGSSPKEWEDLDGASIVAHAATSVMSRIEKNKCKTALGIGGPHYNAKFTRMALESRTAFGHMIPKYAVPGLTQATIIHCLNRVLEKTEMIVLDWKGVKGEDRPSLMENLRALDLPIIKV